MYRDIEVVVEKHKSHPSWLIRRIRITFVRKAFNFKLAEIISNLMCSIGSNLPKMLQVVTGYSELFGKCDKSTLICSKGEQVRHVNHFHYTAWLDEDVPEDPKSLLEFISFVRKRVSTNGGPVVVHCRYIHQIYQSFLLGKSALQIFLIVSTAVSAVCV